MSGDEDAVTSLIKRHWGVVVTVLGIVVPILLTYADMKSTLAVLRNDVDTLKQQIPLIAAERPSAGVSFTNGEKGDGGATGKDDEPAAPSASAGMPSAPPARTTGALGPPILPPVCVSMATRRKFACETAKKCWPPARFKREYYEQLRNEVGAEEILVCDPR